MDKFPSWKEIEHIAEIVSNQKNEPIVSEQDRVFFQPSTDMHTQLQNLKSLSVKLEIEKSIQQYRENSYDSSQIDSHIKINKQA